MLGRYSIVMALLLTAAVPCFAHDLRARHEVLPNGRILVYCWYNGALKQSPARGAEVEVRRAGGEPIRGTTDDEGCFTFSYDRAEEMTIVVRQAGHVNHPFDVVQVDELGDSSPSVTDPSTSGEVAAAATHLQKAADDSSRQALKDLLLGVSLIFAAAAFVMSLRNARRLRDIQRLLAERRKESGS
jgi:hypothetical protein